MRPAGAPGCGEEYRRREDKMKPAIEKVVSIVLLAVSLLLWATAICLLVQE